MFCEKCVLKEVYKKYLCQSLLISLHLYQKDTSSQLFSYEFCKIFKNISFMVRVLESQSKGPPVQNHQVAPRSTQPFILPWSWQWSAALRQFEPIHKRGRKVYLKKESRVTASTMFLHCKHRNAHNVDGTRNTLN